jgi:hypothetical protein
MTYNEAKKKILIRWLLGAPITIIATISSVVSTLKMFYFGLDNGDKLSGMLALPFKRLVYLIYENTRALDWFWIHSPTPTPREQFSNDNIAFFAIYLCIFLGMGLITSARAMSARLARIDKEIEDQLIHDSVRPPRITGFRNAVRGKHLPADVAGNKEMDRAADLNKRS